MLLLLLLLLLLLVQLTGQLLAHDLAERSLARAEATQRRALPAIGTDRQADRLRQLTRTLTRRHIGARTETSGHFSSRFLATRYVHRRRNTGPDLLRTFVGQ
uniref:Putative secreted peptide n=1 Tax=Anopheles braziliensis TaxID=58242 RepID=A0A2M3ZQ07_9DIPT